MICTNAKEGVDCFFMNKKGCQFNGGICHTTVEECETCEKIEEFPTGTYCLTFPDPAAKWRAGRCNMATHLTDDKKKGTSKVNPLKASKRRAS